MSLTLDSFISLEHVAKKLGTQLDDQPDLFRTLERCDDANCSFAIWCRSAVAVWRYGPYYVENPLMPLMGRGDYIDQWQGAFFLTRECIEDLFKSNGHRIKVAEFYPKEDEYSLTQRLTVASSKDIALAEYREREKEILEEMGESSIEHLSHRDQALLKSLKACHEDCSNDDSYLTFSIEDLVILRSDLAKLNLTDQRKARATTAVQTNRMSAPSEHTLAWKTIVPLTEDNILAWLHNNIHAEPMKKDGDSQAQYLNECFSKLGFEQGDSINNIIVNVIDNSGHQFGVSKRSMADKRRQLGFKGNSKSQIR